MSYKVLFPNGEIRDVEPTGYLRDGDTLRGNARHHPAMLEPIFDNLTNRYRVEGVVAGAYQFVALERPRQ